MIFGSVSLSVGVIAVIEQLIGNDKIKILKVRYNAKLFGFEVECSHTENSTPLLVPFNKEFFPNHTPVPFLDEQVQIGEMVHVWFKEEAILKSEGWKDVTKHTMANPDSPFKIGKGKKPYLGGSHKAVVCLDSKFTPLLAINNYRFTPDLVKCIIKSELMNKGKSVEVNGSDGPFHYDSDSKTITLPGGGLIKGGTINGLVDLFRQAGLV